MAREIISKIFSVMNGQSFLTVALYRDQFYNQFLLNCVPGILSREGVYQNIGIATPVFCTIRE